MIVRRALAAVFIFCLLTAPLVAEAQPGAKVYRIAYLGNSSATLEPELVSAFRQGLRDLNYVEGKNLIIEYRWAEGRYDRFPALVAEVVQLKVDVIVTAGTPAILAAKNGTRTIPIVMAVIGDPVAAGVVPSLARPGGNITGSASMTPDIDGKRLELLKEMAPGEARRSAHRAAHDVRAGDQSQGRPGPSADHSAIPAAAGGRGYPVTLARGNS